MPSAVIFTLVLATFAICTVNMQGDPESSDPNCNKTGDANNVYTACTFTCEGDEIIVLQNREKCYLPGGKGASPSKYINGATGQCVDGKCILK
uniref:Mucin n=1 Tax=Rhipicephalus appendiculatus TaxID=34631 RepID=A0A131YTJ6_RHIAP